MYNWAVIVLHSNTFLLKSDLQVLLKINLLKIWSANVNQIKPQALLKYKNHSKLVWQNFDPQALLKWTHQALLSISVYDKTYIKAKVRKFDGKIKTNFLGNEVPKENMYYTYIACITIDFVMKMGKKLFSFLFIRNSFQQTCLIIKS